MKLFESYGDYINRSHVRDLCQMIVEGSNIDRSLMILSDMFRDAGNDLKADLIAKYKDPAKHPAFDRIQAMFKSAFERGRDSGYLTYGVGQIDDFSERQIWVSISTVVSSSGIFTRPVKIKPINKKESGFPKLGSIPLVVTIFSPVKEELVERCRGMQMSVLQHCEVSGDNPSSDLVRVRIHPLSLIRLPVMDRDESGHTDWKLRDLYDSERQPAGPVLLNLGIEVEGHNWYGLRDGIRFKISKHLIDAKSKKTDPSEYVNGDFLKKCVETIKHADQKHLSFHRDFESLSYLKRILSIS